MQREVCFGDLLERGAKRGDERMRQTIDETHGVGDEQFAAIRKTNLADERIQRDEERVGREGVLVGDSVEQRGLSRVGVPDQRHGWDRLLVPALAQLRTALPQMVDLLLDRSNARADAPAVALELRLARTPGADASTKT